MARPKAITSLKDASNAGKRNWLIYADSGTGKTVLGGTAPNALFLTVEAGGTESAKTMGSTADEWVVDTWEELMEAYTWLKSEGAENYEWVVLDSLSEMEEACWRAHLKDAKAANSSRNIYQPAIQDYQIVGNKMKAMVDAFNRLNVNILYTAQAMRIDVEDEENDDTTTLLLPLLGSTKNGVLSQKVCGMVTLVGRLTVSRRENEQGEVEELRRLHLNGTKRFVAKDRHNLSRRGVIKNPNIAQMVSRLDAKLASAPAEEPSGAQADGDNPTANEAEQEIAQDAAEHDAATGTTRRQALGEDTPEAAQDGTAVPEDTDERPVRRRRKTYDTEEN